MAKTKDPVPTIVSTSYRVERLSTFGWQAIQVQIFSDNSIKEENVGKEDVLELVVARISKRMREEGQVNFMAKKRAGNE